MFKWFTKRPDAKALTEGAREDIFRFLEIGDHEQLIELFRASIIEYPQIYLMPEMHIGALISRLTTLLENTRIELYTPNRASSERAVLNLDPTIIFLNTQHIKTTENVTRTLISGLMAKLGYKGGSVMHLPSTLGRHISESSKV